MKSSIKIDLNWDNQPILEIKKQYSDDVRDKLVDRFVSKTPFFKVPSNFDPGVGTGPLPDIAIIPIEAVEKRDLLNLIEYIKHWMFIHPDFDFGETKTEQNISTESGDYSMMKRDPDPMIRIPYHVLRDTIKLLDDFLPRSRFEDLWNLYFPYSDL